ncbi:hypothetical protein BDN67DRAFT_666973 [Paxillus ammoniavirescens]|nr:hypothetical protein BDN67DRAFT_666973 [Paxillus ammoniavirescens]
MLSREESLMVSINSSLPHSATSPFSPNMERGDLGSSVAVPFYGELFTETQPWSEARQAEFAADLCQLIIACNMAWLAVEIPYWRAFFSKWLPGVMMPGRQELSGRVLDEQVENLLGEMKVKVQDRYGTGQCDGWKNVSKTSIIGTMINVEYTPYLLNTIDISAKPKTAVELLKLVEAEIKYAVEVLKIIIVGWCTDASGESAKMRRLLVRKMPHLVVVDCWAHQINLIVGDVFKIKHHFIEIVNDALEVVKWFNNHSRALALLQDAQMAKLNLILTLILPVLTRWTSHYLSVTRLVKLELAFKQMLLDAGEDLETLIVCGGTKADAKRKAKEVLDILQRPSFWPDLRSIKRHLEPLAIAANATQSDFTRLDVVLATLVNLYRQFLEPTLDLAVRTAVLASIEKRWAKSDQQIFILALVLNPYIRASAFSRTSPYRMPDKLWDLARKAFLRFYGVEPNMEFRAAFIQYGCSRSREYPLKPRRSVART